ncbi:MAG: hypothetical protein ACKV2T_23220 [Kofleriaceae bacterium]
MWRVVIACVLAAGCAESVDYEVTLRVQQSSMARIVVDGLLFQDHTETYVVDDYDELRDAAASATVRANSVDHFIVLPFVASECGSERWAHTGELTRIEVEYMIYASSTTFEAFANRLTCTDSNGETHSNL